MSDIIFNLKKNVKSFIKNNFFRLLLFYVRPIRHDSLQKDRLYLSWLGSELIVMVNEFFGSLCHHDLAFTVEMDRIFHTTRFEKLIKKWLSLYLLNLFDRLYEFQRYRDKTNAYFELEDNPLNKFAVKKYSNRFGETFSVRWLPQMNRLRKLLFFPILILYTLKFIFRPGIKFSGEKKRFKLMREALWGVKGRGYFRDDFLVDGNKIFKDDLLLFSREVMKNDPEGRLKAYHEAKKGGYAVIFLPSLRIGLNELLGRVLPLYIFRGVGALWKTSWSANFSLFQNIYFDFVSYAVPYEKLFSNYAISAELGHNYFSFTHICESIICQNYGVKYYLMHWSDNAISINNYFTAYLGCDKYLIWGEGHIQGFEGENDLIKSTGYVFKRLINSARKQRKSLALEMGVPDDLPVVSFFDESFGSGCEMTEANFVSFWEAILSTSERLKESIIVVKPKGEIYQKRLSPSKTKRFISVKTRLSEMPNVRLIDPKKWSFIEVIGISDIVVTQGMTSSATIALVCGIEGLYLDEFGYEHPFSRGFKNRLVFDQPEPLIDKICQVIREGQSPLKEIPEQLMRSLDAYPGDSGIDFFRDIICASDIVEVN